MRKFIVSAFIDGLEMQIDVLRGAVQMFFIVWPVLAVMAIVWLIRN